MGVKSAGLNSSLSLYSWKVNWFWASGSIASVTVGGLKISFHLAEGLCW